MRMKRHTQSERDRNSERESNVTVVTILQVKIDRVEDTEWWKEILRQTAEVGFLKLTTN